MKALADTDTERFLLVRVNDHDIAWSVQSGERGKTPSGKKLEFGKLYVWRTHPRPYTVVTEALTSTEADEWRARLGRGDA